ncbi:MULTISPECIES: flagellar hook-basal body complex protein [unclassified Iodidimonas]|jgi:flagellar hook protein FlgE|uniref:flagellar hook protein FlgE n=1 Tax=unclassified Iodidimonas TaxID=2626145 RepID=UPI002482C7DA|nr:MULTISPECIES: flagellar hook-basal body complex protein [unclassified Iodidimonas]
MSLGSALQAGVSGLLAQATRLATISDNLANSSVVGFKRSDVDFTSLFVGTGGGSSFAASGTIPNVRTDISLNGTITTSSGSTDLAIAGRGMFVVTSDVAGTGANEFALTRAGQFSPDANGFLRNSAGFVLQGFALNPDGSFAAGIPSRDTFGSLQPVNINAFNNIGTPTTQLGLQGNLPAQLTGLAPPPGPLVTSVEYFTPLGAAQTLTLEWQATATPNQFNLSITDFDGTALGTVTIDFDDGITPGVTAGSPAAFTTALPEANGVVTLTVNGGQVIELSLGNVGGLNGITQFVGDNSVRAPVRDGTPAGELRGVEIGDDGTVFAIFDSGARLASFIIPVADLANPNGLQPIDGNAFQLTRNSGTFRLFNPGEGPSGELRSNALEVANVEIAQEITSIIETQRAYSSNATVIRTADEMLEEATRLKR